MIHFEFISDKTNMHTIVMIPHMPKICNESLDTIFKLIVKKTISHKPTIVRLIYIE